MVKIRTFMLFLSSKNFLRLTPRGALDSSALVFAVMLPASSILTPLIRSLRFLPSFTIWTLKKTTVT